MANGEMEKFIEEEDVPKGLKQIDSVLLRFEGVAIVCSFFALLYGVYHVWLLRSTELSLWEQLLLVVEGVAKATLLFVGLLLLLLGLRQLFVYLEARTRKVLAKKVKQEGELGQIVAVNLEFLLVSFDLLRVLSILVIISVYVPLAFKLFPRTKTLGTTILQYLIDPLMILWDGFLAGLPNIIAIIVFIWFANYSIKILKVFTDAVRLGKIRIGWLPTASALPFFHVVRIGIILFTFVAVFQRLPGAESTEFKAIAGFGALILSLSSTSAAGNFVAGLVLTFMRAFKVGDRVRIKNVVGDVVECSLVSTKIVTPTNEKVTIPNMQVLGEEIVNYTTLGKTRGVMLCVPISIGYDVPASRVESLLLKAASETRDIEQIPAPMVLQRSLGDYSIVYELRASTKQVRQMLKVESDLIKKTLEQFDAAGVEILSPMYNAVRDGNSLTIPSQQNEST